MYIYLYLCSEYIFIFSLFKMNNNKRSYADALNGVYPQTPAVSNAEAETANAVKREASSRPLNEGAKKRPRHEAGRVSKKPSTKVIKHVAY